MGSNRGVRLLAWIGVGSGVALFASYPALSALALSTSLAPSDLLVLRFFVSAVVLAPYLWWIRKTIPASLWRQSVWLSFLHGWGMAGAALIGLQFAPASHAAALGPGTISIWIAMLSYALYRRTPGRWHVFACCLIASGAILLMAQSITVHGWPVLRGDLLFVGASILGAGYLVYAQQHRIPAVLGAAIVGVVSGLVTLPLYLLFGSGALLQASGSEVLWHGIYQGILIGCVSFSLINFGVLSLGSQAVGLLMAMVPVLGGVLSVGVLGLSLTQIEWLALVTISIGVAGGLLKKRPQSSGIKSCHRDGQPIIDECERRNQPVKVA